MPASSYWLRFNSKPLPLNPGIHLRGSHVQFGNRAPSPNFSPYSPTLTSMVESPRHWCRYSTASGWRVGNQKWACISNPVGTLYFSSRAVLCCLSCWHRWCVDERGHGVMIGGGILSPHSLWFIWFRWCGRGRTHSDRFFGTIRRGARWGGFQSSKKRPKIHSDAKCAHVFSLWTRDEGFWQIRIDLAIFFGGGF